MGVRSDVPWGKASAELVKLIYDDRVLAVIATDRNSSHLAEQLAVKAFVPLIAMSADHTLTAANIPWIFRLPGEAAPADAFRLLVDGRRPLRPEPRPFARGSRRSRNHPRPGRSHSPATLARGPGLEPRPLTLGPWTLIPAPDAMMRS